jgi:hypothetical protein
VRTRISGGHNDQHCQSYVLITLKTYGGETEGGSSQIKYCTRAIAPYNRGIKRNFSVSRQT